MALKALIFDVDGTIAETEEAHRKAFNQCFRRWKLGWNWSVDTYRELLQTTGGKERIRAFQDGLPDGSRQLSDEEIAVFHKEKTASYITILQHGYLDLRPGVAALIDAARARGIRIALATTTNMPNIEALAECGWGRSVRDLFDVIAAGDEVAAKKPAPDVYDLALRRLGLAPGDCVAFEDSLAGLRAARSAGLRVVVTPSVYTDHQDFSAAQLVLPSLEGLPLETLGAL